MPGYRCRLKISKVPPPNFTIFLTVLQLDTGAWRITPVMVWEVGYEICLDVSCVGYKSELSGGFHKISFQKHSNDPEDLPKNY